MMISLFPWSSTKFTFPRRCGRMQVSKWRMAMIGHPCFLHQTVRLPLFVPSPLLQLALPDSGDLFFHSDHPAAISILNFILTLRDQSTPVDTCYLHGQCWPCSSSTYTPHVCFALLCFPFLCGKSGIRLDYWKKGSIRGSGWKKSRGNKIWCIGYPGVRSDMWWW